MNKHLLAGVLVAAFTTPALAEQFYVAYRRSSARDRSKRQAFAANWGLSPKPAETPIREIAR